MPVFAYESAMSCLSAEISANRLFIQEDKKKKWILNEELYDKRKLDKRVDLVRVPTSNEHLKDDDVKVQI